MLRHTRLGLLLVACAAIPAQAQLAPGIEPPDSAATASSMAQMMGCTFAALGRPSPVSNKEGYPEGGLVFRESAPPALLKAAELPSEGTLAFELSSPEGPVWILNNQRRRTCAVVTTSGDLKAAEAVFVGDYEEGMMGYKEVSSKTPGIRQYRSRQLGLTVLLKSAVNPSDPFVVLTQAKR